MWLIEFCERASSMSSDGKIILVFAVCLSMMILGAIYDLAHKAIKRMGKKDNDQK